MNNTFRHTVFWKSVSVSLHNEVIHKQIVKEKQMQCCDHHEKFDRLYFHSPGKN